MGFALDSHEEGFTELQIKETEQHFLNTSFILTNYMHLLTGLIRHAPLN